jgi:hypothetical protein
MFFARDGSFLQSYKSFAKPKERKTSKESAGVYMQESSKEKIDWTFNA